MADHFKFYPAEDTVVAPWTAQYSYPAQSNKALKTIARIQPRSGTSFGPGQIIRIDLPAQGYLNTTNTQLVFDAVLIAPSMVSHSPAYPYSVRFQNNISCIFNRVRFLYGGTPQEDIQQYGVLTRLLTEWTTTNQMGVIDQTSISDGVGGYSDGINVVNTNTTGPVYSNLSGLVQTRQHYIQGLQANMHDDGVLGTVYENNVPNVSVGATLPSGISTPSTPYCVRRYMVSFALGLFCQDKLLPTKWMASQLTIEITLEQANTCIYQPIGADHNAIAPTYAIGNVELIIEQIEFDDEYDRGFLDALESKGIPIKFSTWDWFQFATQGASSNQYQITERSRSIKGMFVVQRRNPPDFQYDSHACFYDTNPSVNASVGSTLQSAQWRVGGRYFPGSPTQYSANVGGNVTNGGAEGVLDLQKFLNTVGNYALQTNLSLLNFAVPAAAGGTYNEYDYSKALLTWDGHGTPSTVLIETQQVGPTVSRGTDTCGNMPSGAFACAVNFETSNGIEIAGLNGEEQTDISFNVRWSSAQAQGFTIEAFVYVDKMWVLKPNNYLDLIQ